jgi:lysR-type transcriptional regulator
LPLWCGERINELTLEGSFRLSYNASVFTREGLGYLLTFEHLVDTSSESGLVFRPLYPELTTDMFIIWKKHQVFTTIAERFISELQKEFGRNN